MTDWEDSYYQSLTPEWAWKSPAVAADFTAAGNGVAERLADELGQGFEVEFQSYELGVPVRVFASRSPAGSPLAADTFRRIAAAADAERVRLLALSQEPGVGYYAYAPLSGTEFRPNPPGLD
ncbi:hypothetical protein AL755_14820 [Arthrobacter sp. ERGS1:01]|uniref:hypothetical protein n=1 Tax=Arthrobacter sp. ERGS1:01 TaxID=1704044 RepID=UPI0006B580F9|nr:hypothetical protein [Arthrobacter sp. ERGS1:01]ALE06435.1 hypothetical protein AL755_14820 [Arthrobacter sp. ERGS1:01]